MSLQKEARVNDYLAKNSLLKKFMDRLDEKGRDCAASIIFIDQAEIVFAGLLDNESSFKNFKELVDTLLHIDLFFASIGGIVGYHNKFCSLLNAKKIKNDDISFLDPHPVDISKRTSLVQDYIEEGLVSLPQMAEIYPLGGAGDRLNLIDEKTKEHLPQAKLDFLGKTLLEHLILDLQAREYLYFQKFDEKLFTPIVIMTSEAKNNHAHIMEIFEEKRFFNRPKECFFFIKQLSVPVINATGSWVMDDCLKLCLKPGGHGMLWNLMVSHNVFDWLYNKGRQKAIVRQINNPIAALDYNLLAFAGCGIKENKSFGFASCPRIVGTSEGMDVLKEKRLEGYDTGYEYSISNIEYTDFQKYGIVDLPKDEKRPYSKFPSNTNILFIDLKDVEEAAKKDPLPGITINLKNTYIQNNKECKAGRLELLMQSIADNFYDFSLHKIKESEELRLSTFITNNKREKTISAIKHSYEEGKDVLGTPMGAYADLHQNYRDILINYCDFKLPLEDKDLIIQGKGTFFCYLSPLIGPTYEEIEKKIQGGKIEKFSELRLDFGEVQIENLHLDGSFVVEGDFSDFNNMGHLTLKNVEIINSGIEHSQKKYYFENKIDRKESFHIILHENSSFIAEDVTFKGNHRIEVPKGHTMVAYTDRGEIKFESSAK